MDDGEVDKNAPLSYMHEVKDGGFAWRRVDIMGDGVSGVFILTEERCDVLVTRRIGNCRMKCMNGDERRSSQELQL